MDDAKTYVETHLRRELEEFQRLGIGQEVTQLSVYEKVLVFHYTGEGYRALNRALRAGQFHPMESLLNEALGKLPDYVGTVFRGAPLPASEVEKLLFCWKQETPYVELAYFSTSKAEHIAKLFSEGDAVFEVFSFHGKAIQALSKFGKQSRRNEQEILFKSKSHFLVTGFSFVNQVARITLEEIP